MQTCYCVDGFPNSYKKRRVKDVLVGKEKQDVDPATESVTVMLFQVWFVLQGSLLGLAASLSHVNTKVLPSSKQTAREVNKC